MSSPDTFLAGQVGDAAREFEDTVVGPGGKVETGNGLFQQRFTGDIEGTVAIDLAAGQLRVGFALAQQLPLPRRGHPLADVRGRLPALGAGQFRLRDRKSGV